MSDDTRMAALRARAHGLGLERLTDEQLLQFERAIAAARRHLQRLPADIAPAQEPAAIFRAAAAFE